VIDVVREIANRRDARGEVRNAVVPFAEVHVHVPEPGEEHLALGVEDLR
jgi:hypothetical protein